MEGAVEGEDAARPGDVCAGQFLEFQSVWLALILVRINHVMSFNDWKKRPHAAFSVYHTPLHPSTKKSFISKNKSTVASAWHRKHQTCHGDENKRAA